jgi:hypothetical protein
MYAWHPLPAFDHQSVRVEGYVIVDRRRDYVDHLAQGVMVDAQRDAFADQTGLVDDLFDLR